MTLPGLVLAPDQLRFSSIPGSTIRGEFEGGGLSSDFGALLVGGIDRQFIASYAGQQSCHQALG